MQSPSIIVALTLSAAAGLIMTGVTFPSPRPPAQIVSSDFDAGELQRCEAKARNHKITELGRSVADIEGGCRVVLARAWSQRVALARKCNSELAEIHGGAGTRLARNYVQEQCGL